MTESPLDENGARGKDITVGVSYLKRCKEPSRVVKRIEGGKRISRTKVVPRIYAPLGALYFWRNV